MSSKILNPGEKFGDCTVERQLGAGGLGTVWLVRQASGGPPRLANGGD